MKKFSYSSRYLRQSLLSKEIPMEIKRVSSGGFVANGLPDGSRIIVNSNNETVFALNATAGAAWDACSDVTTLDKVTESMRRSFDPNVTEELAEAAILELEEKKLVTISGSQPKTTRREVLAGLSAVALPLVVSLTVGEQRAHAQTAKSHAGGSGGDDDDHRFGDRPSASVPKHERLGED